MLKGHERSLTFLKYNYEGDLLFTCAKDKSPCVWWSDNGERIGTYEGHTGAVWSLDVTRDSKYLITGSADTTVRIWNVMTGESIVTVAHKGPCHGVAWAEGDLQYATITDPFGMEVPASVSIYDFTSGSPESTPKVPRIEICDRENPRVKATRVGWLPLNEGLLVAYESGMMRVYDPSTGEVQREWKAHEASVSSFVFNSTKTLLITSSHDKTAKLWDVKDMRVIQTYTADVPLNSASISPITEHIIVGGGQEAMAVTTTAASAGKFESRFYHMVFGHELGRVKGHFGPINTLAFHPDGRSFTSGAEDGYLRLHILDPDYFALGDEDNLDDPAVTSALTDGTFEDLETEEAAARQREKETAQAIKAVVGSA